MKFNYEKLGNLIEISEKKNSDLTVENLVGMNINKEFMPSVANTIGTNLARYKVIHKDQFACNLMHVGRDKSVVVSKYPLEKPSIISPAYKIFQVKDTSIILPDFLMLYFLKSEFDRLGWFYTDSSIRGSLDWSKFCNIEIPVPDIDVQKKIVDVCQFFNELIALKERINNNLEQFSQNLFKKWFIDFDLKNDFGICEDFKDSSLGEIPQSWEIRTVGELSDVKGRIGWRGYTTNDLVDDGPWVIGGKEITSGYIDFSSAKHLTREKYEESPEIMLKDKDLIIAKTGTIGPIAMFYEGFGEATLNPNVGLIRSKSISPALLLTFFKTPRAQYYLNEFTTSSVQPAINQTTIKQLEVALPSDILLLNKISLIFDEINDMQYNLIGEVKQLFKLRDTLLPKLMAGEIDVSKINCD